MVIERIVHAIDPAPGQCILEIGPGQAALSIPLAESGADLHLIEIDRDLAGRLLATFGDASGVSLHMGDALTMDFAEITGGRRFRLVGNLPYNISTPLLFHVFQFSGLVTDIHFMLQQEVVDRMAAAPGGKSRGRLSVMCQYYCEVTPLFRVPPEAFTPAPKVHSAVVRLVPHARPPVQLANPRVFETLVGKAFSARRKTLRNSLRGLLESADFESAGIDPGLRAESLSLAQFAALSNRASALMARDKGTGIS